MVGIGDVIGDLMWTNGSLRQFLEKKFPDTPSLDCESIMFPKSFNAYDVENLGGIMVEFTDNLADHLRLVRNGAAVLIFHHVSFLEFAAARGYVPRSPRGGSRRILWSNSR